MAVESNCRRKKEALGAALAGRGSRQEAGKKPVAETTLDKEDDYEKDGAE